MRYSDPLYGKVEIKEPVVLELMKTSSRHVLHRMLILRNYFLRARVIILFYFKLGTDCKFSKKNLIIDLLGSTLSILPSPLKTPKLYKT